MWSTNLTFSGFFCQLWREVLTIENTSICFNVRMIVVAHRFEIQTSKPTYINVWWLLPITIYFSWYWRNIYVSTFFLSMYTWKFAQRCVQSLFFTSRSLLGDIYGCAISLSGYWSNLSCMRVTTQPFSGYICLLVCEAFVCWIWRWKFIILDCVLSWLLPWMPKALLETWRAWSLLSTISSQATPLIWLEIISNLIKKFY